MNLADTVRFRAFAAEKPQKPAPPKEVQADAGTGEWFETYSIGAIPTNHAPSNKRPDKIKEDLPTRGWHPNDPPEERQKAITKLVEMHEKMLRQIGRPTLAQTASYPVSVSWVK